MAHKHNIVENDPHFEINPHTRAVLYTGEKEELLVQYDHNSERFTFQMPRFVEGHDMLSSDRVEIHFKNIGSRNDEEKDGVYYVDDVAEVPDTDNISFSWLISNEATQFAGTLKFVIRFVCLTDERRVSYSWSTATCSGKWIGEGMINNDTIEEDYSLKKITANGTYDVSQYERVLVNVPTSGGNNGGSESGEPSANQTLTLVSSLGDDWVETYTMPEGYTFEQLIGSEYDTSEGDLSISQADTLKVMLNIYDVMTSEGDFATPDMIASGTYYFGDTQTLTIIDVNTGNSEIYTMPKRFTFGVFVGSKYDTSYGSLDIGSTGEVTYGLTTVKTSEGIAATRDTLASGTFYCGDSQTLTLVDYKTNETIVSYAMPEGFTFNQLIASPYNVNGLFSKDEMSGVYYAFYGGYTIKNSTGAIVKASEKASGTLFV